VIVVRGDPRRLALTTAAVFMLPDGSALELAPTPWQPPE
jgi:hypothetical protein